ncbi:MAG: hypothetical protein LBS14_01725 [Holosporaceae bacterium]|jgi:hypothetical protein|nr:hypothetical protein [Holosporaceae bacterium]
MKQVLTSEDINFLEEKLGAASEEPWSLLENDAVDTVWVIPGRDGKPLALLDYQSKEMNSANAGFIVASRNYMRILLDEIKNLRRRILELIQSNNIEVQRREDLQSELQELKKMLRTQDEPGLG